MAANDVIDVEIGTTGDFIDITFGGFQTATIGNWVIDLGSGNGLPLASTDLSNATIVITVVSKGYSGGILGTIVRTCYGVKVRRKIYPNNTEQHITASGVDGKLRVNLNRSIYDKDRLDLAGDSGTDPIITIKVGKIGDGTNTNNAYTAQSILKAKNLSTVAYPNVVARWTHAPGDVVGNSAFPAIVGNTSTTVELSAACVHPFGIDQVDFDLADQSANSATTVSETVQKINASSTTGKVVIEYVATMSLVGMNDEKLTGDFIAYPNVGDSTNVKDSSAGTAQPAMEFGSFHVWNDAGQQLWHFICNS